MAESEQALEANAGEGKMSLKMLIIIIVSVLLLSGGGIGAYIFFIADNSQQSANEKPVAVKETYYHLAESLIVDFPEGSVARLIQLSISFLVVEGTPEVLSKHEPMIRNNLLMLIGAQDVNGLATFEGKEKLREEIKQEVIKVMGGVHENVDIKEVFFTAFVMQ